MSLPLLALTLTALAIPSARVEVKGETTEARLVSAEGQLFPVGAVPPGTYTFEALVSERRVFVRLNLGQLTADERVRIQCSELFASCRIVEE